jgi:hypothetical protein
VSAARPTLRRRREGAGLGQGGEWGTGAEAGERRGYRGAGGTQRIGGVEGERGRVTRGGRSRQGRVLHASLSAAHPRGRWVTGGAPGLQRGHVGVVLAGSGRPRVPRWRETAGRGGGWPRPLPGAPGSGRTTEFAWDGKRTALGIFFLLL